MHHHQVLLKGPDDTSAQSFYTHYHPRMNRFGYLHGAS
ncbi:hypothetical protein APED_29680 [Acanthopleuribacter pedis]